ncbi:MAG: phosphomannomutase/phosphoglucomutase [Candidatus Levybacteria bacterium]|nr:phosphomannomutase/phosphoglucomutase [Candidatus Levybacteria bacterium]MBP9815434.1 phosphomannomutase/phosphoglucomutase [Candidatus Levybacteria bacterium]
MALVSDHIFKGYDIRGIYPTDYNEENIIPIVKAVYTFLHKGKKENEPLTVVVGTDMRTSSPSLTKIAIDTLVQLGANVIDIGMVSTPTFYFAVSYYGYESGFQITASHNPKEWNGMKIVKNSPGGLIKIGKSGGLMEIKENAINGKSVLPQPGGKVEKKHGILEDEVKNALKIVGNPVIKKYRIVADTANAMGAQYIEALFNEVPAELIKMNFEYDGTFPAHQPDPLQAETLVELQKRVVKEHADLGLAPDGDGDRLFFIDENGSIVPPTIITSIIAKDLLKRSPGDTVLVDIRYLLTPKKILEEVGGKMKITKVGHAYITEGLHESGGIFAGESSAHYFFRETGNAESQMPVILTILKVMSEEGKTLSELVAEYRRSYESGEINFKVKNAADIMEKIKEKYIDCELVTVDGVAINYPTWRASIRTSNTEPLLRLNVESLDESEMFEKRDELKGFIEENAIQDSTATTH